MSNEQFFREKSLSQRLISELKLLPYEVFGAAAGGFFGYEMGSEIPIQDLGDSRGIARFIALNEILEVFQNMEYSIMSASILSTLGLVGGRFIGNYMNRL